RRAALVPGVRRSQRASGAALEGAAPDDLGQHVGWASEEQRERFGALMTRLLARGAIAGHLAAETVAERLRYTLADRPRLCLDDATVVTVRDWARTARADIDACASGLVG